MELVLTEKLDELQKAKEKRDRYKEALEFYAEGNHYEITGVGYGNLQVSKATDFGEKAQEVLE